MPQKKKSVQVQLPRHKHCVTCGLPVSANKVYCSPQCEEEARKVSRRRNYTMLFTILIFPILLIAMLIFSSGK